MGSVAKPLFKDTNTFRLNSEEAAEFNRLFESLHPEHRPLALRELFVNMFRAYVNKTANVKVNAGENAENVNANTDERILGAIRKYFDDSGLEISAGEGHLELLHNLMDQSVRRRKALADSQHTIDKYMELAKALEPLREKTEAWFKTYFQDETFTGLTFRDLAALLVDYAERDPSKEFPFEPVAVQIYERLKGNAHNE